MKTSGSAWETAGLYPREQGAYEELLRKALGFVPQFSTLVQFLDFPHSILRPAPVGGVSPATQRELRLKAGQTFAQGHAAVKQSSGGWKPGPPDAKIWDPTTMPG